MKTRDQNMNDAKRGIMRDVFLSDPKGRDVLKILLGDMGFFSEADTEETRITKNYATRLVHLLGPDSGDLLATQIVDAIHTSYSMEYKSSKKEIN
jgi:hypothetical protein